MRKRLMSGDCIAAACCLLSRPKEMWPATLDELFGSHPSTFCGQSKSSLMSLANGLGRAAEPFWSDRLFCEAMIAVLRRVQKE